MDSSAVLILIYIIIFCLLSDMRNLRNIVVTGSNKGVGFGIVENLAAKQGWNIIMACRSMERADQAKR